MLVDTIFISQLEIETIIGIHAWEQKTPRKLVFDVEMGVDIRPAAASDHIRDAVDYKAVSDSIVDVVSKHTYQLLEALSEAVARRLFERFPLLTLKLTIGKPGAVPEAKTVGVRIERRREDYAVCGR